MRYTATYGWPLNTSSRVPSLRPVLPHSGKFCKYIELVVNGQSHAACGDFATVFLNVIADVSEIANGRVRPASEHQPGYRSSIIFMTSE